MEMGRVAEPYSLRPGAINTEEFLTSKPTNKSEQGHFLEKCPISLNSNPKVPAELRASEGRG